MTGERRDRQGKLGQGEAVRRLPEAVRQERKEGGLPSTWWEGLEIEDEQVTEMGIYNRLPGGWPPLARSLINQSAFM